MICADSNKATYASVWGLDVCRKRIDELTQQAVEAIQVFDDVAFLTELVQKLATRNK